LSCSPVPTKEIEKYEKLLHLFSKTKQHSLDLHLISITAEKMSPNLCIKEIAIKIPRNDENMQW